MIKEQWPRPLTREELEKRAERLERGLERANLVSAFIDKTPPKRLGFPQRLIDFLHPLDIDSALKDEEKTGNFPASRQERETAKARRRTELFKEKKDDISTMRQRLTQPLTHLYDEVVGREATEGEERIFGQLERWEEFQPIAEAYSKLLERCQETGKYPEWFEDAAEAYREAEFRFRKPGREYVPREIKRAIVEEVHHEQEKPESKEDENITPWIQIIPEHEYLVEEPLLVLDKEGNRIEIYYSGHAKRVSQLSKPRFAAIRLFAEQNIKAVRLQELTERARQIDIGVNPRNLKNFNIFDSIDEELSTDPYAPALIKTFGENGNRIARIAARLQFSGESQDIPLTLSQEHRDIIGDSDTDSGYDYAMKKLQARVEQVIPEAIVRVLEGILIQNQMNRKQFDASFGTTPTNDERVSRTDIDHSLRYWLTVLGKRIENTGLMQPLSDKEQDLWNQLKDASGEEVSIQIMSYAAEQIDHWINRKDEISEDKEVSFKDTLQSLRLDDNERALLGSLLRKYEGGKFDIQGRFIFKLSTDIRDICMQAERLGDIPKKTNKKYPEIHYSLIKKLITILMWDDEKFNHMLEFSGDWLQSFLNTLRKNNGRYMHVLVNKYNLRHRVDQNRWYTQLEGELKYTHWETGMEPETLESSPAEIMKAAVKEDRQPISRAEIEEALGSGILEETAPGVILEADREARKESEEQAALSDGELRRRIEKLTWQQLTLVESSVLAQHLLTIYGMVINSEKDSYYEIKIPSRIVQVCQQIRTLQPVMYHGEQLFREQFRALQKTLDLAEAPDEVFNSLDWTRKRMSRDLLENLRDSMNIVNVAYHTFMWDHPEFFTSVVKEEPIEVPETVTDTVTVEAAVDTIIDSILTPEEEEIPSDPLSERELLTFMTELLILSARTDIGVEQAIQEHFSVLVLTMGEELLTGEIPDPARVLKRFEKILKTGDAESYIDTFEENKDIHELLTFAYFMVNDPEQMEALHKEIPSVTPKEIVEYIKKLQE